MMMTILKHVSRLLFCCAPLHVSIDTDIKLEFDLFFL